MTKVFRIFLAIVALLILLNAGILWAISNYNLGLIAMTILGVFFLLYAVAFNGINRLLNNRFGRFIKAVIILGFTWIFFITALISIAGQMDTVTYKEDAIIVLGAGIHGDKPSRVLKYRLDAAVMYHKLNPEAFIIVSGGQGPQEFITEAEAMERYLLAQNVNPERIIKEERATSTYENFLYSKGILEQKFSTPYKVAYITNRFHVYRAGRVAHNTGLYAARLHAQNDWITILPDYLRECFAIPIYWISGK